MLEGNDNPAGSQQQTSQQPDSRTIEQQTEEEVAFNNLTGSSRDRFKEMFNRARAAEEKAAQLEQIRPQTQQPQNTMLPDQQQALNTLSQFGIATDEKVKKEVASVRDDVLKELRIQNLSAKYSGASGEPKFDREEVEDFIRTHPKYTAYDYEDVFKYHMFPDEFTNLAIQRQTSRPKNTAGQRPMRTGVMTQSNVITPDNVEEMVASHDDAWFDEHRSEINEAVKAHTLQFQGVNFSGK